MTEEEFKNLKFKFVSHLSMEDEHCTTYKAVDIPFSLMACKHTPYKDGVPKRHFYVHYMLNGKVYTSREKLLEAIKEL